MTRKFDIIVIGGGHAGAEAAWAGARLGARVALVSFDPARIGQMSCNPAIGGLAKGQMVREVDALGGLMGLAIDATGIQFRMLNRSKGPAVWGPRAQADKHRYALEVQRLLKTSSNIEIVQGEVVDLLSDRGSPPSITGAILRDGTTLHARAVIVTTGTFLRALMHTGETKTEGGRVGEQSATSLTQTLQRFGLEIGRLKTGTPPRLHKDSIDYSHFTEQPGDDEPMPFSFLNEGARESSELRVQSSGKSDPPELQTPNSKLPPHSPLATNHSSLPWRPPLRQVHCWIGHTNETIHQIIRANIHRAPMYSGQIEGTGPRYCPSIEDKVVRFADKQSHHIFLEPEGLDCDDIYVNGISTSLPGDVQEQMVRLIPGLEQVRILRYGYAVEYDMVWPSQIEPTLQTKRVRGLFLAGQINGTSGYEEAAGQGLVAGVNAARYVATGVADFVLRRDQAYIGVLIDDLVTKPPIEPYRMFTSRAEHRLHLRSDNADERLTPIARDLGLVDDHRWQHYASRQQALVDAEALSQRTRIDGVIVFDWLRRPEVTWDALAAKHASLAGITSDVGRLLEIRAKYAGYVKRQATQIERFGKLESKLIPSDVDYATIAGLRNEARQKLQQFTPRSLGQALRISGITPADVSVLAVHLERRSRSTR